MQNSSKDIFWAAYFQEQDFFFRSPLWVLKVRPTWFRSETSPWESVTATTTTVPRPTRGLANLVPRNQNESLKWSVFCSSYYVIAQERKSSFVGRMNGGKFEAKKKQQPSQQKPASHVANWTAECKTRFFATFFVVVGSNRLSHTRRPSAVLYVQIVKLVVQVCYWWNWRKFVT